ncbi:hypothetical protein phytr_7590 [Candidatus Phycorickettsia trachydisci]|uniref:RDD domain-containing protein n=1 Tax=Candidatus Phycorickettsia trachydisci TaxID=2115978 RepID=A0A2P1P8W9_9RICK|nr:RDD family protein [Candidatus Phycorickettsia trachydisci]AVP87695.1 hypothetical protein phytr_7590 [Candidatus Phycorickettsia trachydisci]
MIQNKQIVYPTFITRMFTMILDSTFLMFVAFVLNNVIFQVVFWINKVDNVKALLEVIGEVGFMKIFLVNIMIQLILFCVYVLGFWFYFSATPSQLALGMKILDNDTLQKPTRSQFIIRFFALFLFPISILFTLFTKRKQALHDMISKTVIISR